MLEDSALPVQSKQCTHLHPDTRVGVVEETMHEELGGSVGSERGCVQTHFVARPDPMSCSAGFSRVQHELGVDQVRRLRQEGEGSVQAEEGGVVVEAAQVPVTYRGSYGDH